MATAESHVTSMQKQRTGPSDAQSVAQSFRSRVAQEAQRVAARFKTAGGWKQVTWEELSRQCDEIAWGFLAMGVNRGDMVSILGSTRIEWTLADMGVALAGGIVVPIYQSNTPEECQFILDNSGAVLVVAEDQKQLAKLQKERARLTRIRHVVLMEGAGDGGWVLSLDDLRAKGRDYKAQHPRELEERVAAGRSDELSSVLYTSGTTGVPKGVMITNDNMIFASESLAAVKVLTHDDSHLLFLPFAHSFAQIIKCAWFGVGFTQIYAESVDKLVDSASETSPTMLAGVPRIFEKAYNSVVAGGMAGPGLAGVLFRMAMREFELYAKARQEGRSYNSIAFTVAKKLVFPKVHQKLKARFGGRIERFISGGAPLARKIAYFFDLIGIPTYEGYGLTETIAVTSVNLPTAFRIGSVGRPFPGVEVKIAEDGEILQRGRHIMRGYLGLPEATAEVIDKEGWFHTGDIGEVNADGYLKITDRKKDLIKTSGGKYIAPQAIEGALKTQSELISQVVVIGDKRKYVSVLVTVVEAEAKKAAGAQDYAEATRSEAVRHRVQEAIDKVNAGLPSYETIKRFHILDRDFAQETGEMTPTLKVKRKACTVKFKKEIDAMYDGESVD